MKFADVEAPAGLDEPRDDPGPAAGVRQPVERADARVDDVELLVEEGGGVVELADDEARVDAELAGDLAGGGDGRLREVEPGDACAQHRPGERVHAEVAVQVEQRFALDVAQRARRIEGGSWSGRRDLNPRPSPWQGDALPLRHFRLGNSALVCRARRGPSRPLRRRVWCAVGGAEEETRTPTPITSTAPSTLRVYQFHHLGIARERAGRSGGTRTPDLRFWRPLLSQLSYTPQCAATVYQRPLGPPIGGDRPPAALPTPPITHSR